MLTTGCRGHCDFVTTAKASCNALVNKCTILILQPTELFYKRYVIVHTFQPTILPAVLLLKFGPL